MSITEMEKARHAEERGAILQALRQEYASEMTSVRSLSRALDLLGYPTTAEGLQFHLSLLADKGYVRIWRAKNVPGFRRDRPIAERGDAIVFARMTPSGLALVDGDAPEDVVVTF